MNVSREKNRPRVGQVTLALLTLALLALLAAQACTGSIEGTGAGQEGAGRVVGADVGQLAPDFTLIDLEDNQIRLSDFRGSIVFINFWATWCPSCRAEMPEIEAVYQDFKGKDVVIIGVDLLESPDEVRRFVEQGDYNWIFVIDTTGEVGNSYEVTAIPTSFFLDREGVIRAINTGAMSKKTIENMLAMANKVNYD